MNTICCQDQGDRKTTLWNVSAFVFFFLIKCSNLGNYVFSQTLYSYWSDKFITKWLKTTQTETYDITLLTEAMSVH